MPRIGFKSITISEPIYQMARKQANQDATSITEIISKAVHAYISKRLDLEDKQRTALKVVQEMERNETT